MDKNPVKVTIINDPLKKQDCDASCGADWSSLQTLDLARKQVNERFGGNIQLTYMDIAGETAGSEPDKWMVALKEHNLSVPLLVINGQLRISGNFNIRQMMDAIEVEMEMEV